MTSSLTPAKTTFALWMAIVLAACSPGSSEGVEPQLAADPQPAEEPEAAVESKPATESPRVIVLGGPEEVFAWLQKENWWGEAKHAEQLSVPHVLITGISPAWKTNAAKLPVRDKKEVFYRFMLPLVMHANEMVMTRRAELSRVRDALSSGQTISKEDLDAIQNGAVLLRVLNEDKAAALAADSPELPGVVDQLLYRLDIVPPGLALGQAAYESGYGTSRFAIQGNALFGQWTFSDGGMAPEQQRKHLGNYGVASFEWPFDSVRGYFINLMSHPAYEDFRRLRAERRAAGEPLSSLALADGLTSYSERGQEYVDDLKGIIRVNHLEVADNAVFRDEPIRFLVTRESPEAAEQTRQEIEQMRKDGKLQEIYERMRLD